MTTLPQDNNRPARKREIALWLIPLVALGIVTALFLSPLWPEAAMTMVESPLPALTQQNAADLCRALEEDPRDYVDDAMLHRRWELRRQSCNMAFAAHPEDLYLKVQSARWMPYEQKAEAIRLWREAAAQGSAEAYYLIYEHHKSWDRGHPERPQSVTRAEAAEALRKAAELGHPFATQMLIRRLEDGDISAALFYSRRTAETFVSLTTGLSARAKLGMLCLSENVAAPLIAAHFVRVALADYPSEEAMMGLALSFARAQNPA